MNTPYPEHEVGQTVQSPNGWVEYPVKHLQQSGCPQGNSFSSLNGQGLGNQFTENNMQKSYNQKGNYDGNGMGLNGGPAHNIGEERFQ